MYTKSYRDFVKLQAVKQNQDCCIIGFARGAPVFGFGPPFSAVRALAARALAQPRPPLALRAAGGQGRAHALRWMPPGVFRRLRAAGARSGTAPSARSPRRGALASLAKVVQRKGQCTNPESGAIIDLPCASHFRYTEIMAHGQGCMQGSPYSLQKKRKRAARKGGSLLILIQ